MAATFTTDVITDHDVFNNWVRQRDVEFTNFYLGGIVVNNPQLDALAMSGGKILSLPFWNPLNGDSEILAEGDDLTVNKITSGQQDARLHTRAKVWGATDLSHALNVNRADPMMAIGDEVAMYWVKEKQKLLVASLEGVFADNVANDSGDMTVSIFTEDGNNATAANLISANAIIDAEATFLDALGEVAGIAVHSVVYTQLKKQNEIEFIRPSESMPEIPVYRGKRVIVNNNLPVRAGTTSGSVYTSYLFGQGAFGYGLGAAPVPSETDREALKNGGETYLVTRDHFVMHPQGMKWTETSVAKTSPSYAELENAANWDRVYDRKNVRVAQILTNG